MTKWLQVTYNHDGDLTAPQCLIDADDDTLFLCLKTTIIGGKLYDRRNLVMDKNGITHIYSCITHCYPIEWPEDV
jgi:hypothetical protein